MRPGGRAHYSVESDTAAKALLEALTGEHDLLAALRSDPLAHALQWRADGAVPLTEAGAFRARAGKAFKAILRAHPPSALWPHHRAEHVLQGTDGSFTVRFANGPQATGRRLVLAMAGYQHREATLDAEVLPGLTLRTSLARRLTFGGELLAPGGLTDHLDQLDHLGRPSRVVVMGSSQSAFRAADLLLRHPQSGALERASTLVLSRSTPRPFNSLENRPKHGFLW